MAKLFRQTLRPAARRMTIARIAAREAGLYAPALHRAAEPQASEGVVNAALRRLEAMERAGLIARTREGAFIVGGAHDARVPGSPVCRRSLELGL